MLQTTREQFYSILTPKSALQNFTLSSKVLLQFVELRKTRKQPTPEKKRSRCLESLQKEMMILLSGQSVSTAIHSP
jgi:hypothetical protein